MRYVKKQLQTTVVADTPEEYDRQMNEIFEKASTIKSITDKELTDKFCSIVRFEFSADIPETVKEQYEKEGRKFFCGDCKFYVKPDKGNVKYTRCEHGDPRCKFNDLACDFFYEMIEAGEDMRRPENV